MCLLCARLFVYVWEYESLRIVVDILYELEIDVYNFVAVDDVKYLRFCNFCDHVRLSIRQNKYNNI